jgi:uncharacterized membrane protein YfcA
MTTAIFIGIIIGLSLGLLGGGGTVLMTPALVYLGGYPVREAIGMSLAVVGGSSLVGGLINLHQGHVHLRAAWLFSAAGIAGAVPGALLTAHVSPRVILVLFGVLMITIALLMLRPNKTKDNSLERTCRPGRCITAGGSVGFLTGFLGVGGGFIIVPALIHFGNLDLRRAIGTSLLVIAVSSFSGLVGHAGQLQLDWPLIGLFLGAALVGLVTGRQLADRIPTAQLRQGFAWLVLGVAIFVIIENWNG